MKKKKKNYRAPSTETLSIGTEELAQLIIPVSGGMTPEESDSKPYTGWLDEDEEPENGNKDASQRPKFTSPWDE